MHLSEAMIQDFPMPAMLPGGYKTGPPTDSTTYLNLNRVAASLVERCMVGFEEAWWQLTGQCNSVRVSVWSTGSQEDREIENEKGAVHTPYFEDVGK